CPVWRSAHNLSSYRVIKRSSSERARPKQALSSVEPNRYIEHVHRSVWQCCTGDRASWSTAGKGACCAHRKGCRLHTARGRDRPCECAGHSSQVHWLIIVCRVDEFESLAHVSGSNGPLHVVLRYERSGQGA